MTPENIAVELKDHENQIKSLKHRMNEQENKTDALNELVTSVKVLAVNMENMANELKKQGKRLDCLEKEPAEAHKHYKQTAVAAIITAVIGTLLGSVLTLIIH